MNMAGNFGGFASTNAFPLLRSLSGSPATYFHAAALLNIAAILCWRLMPGVRPCRRCHALVRTGESTGAVLTGERLDLSERRSP